MTLLMWSHFVDKFEIITDTLSTDTNLHGAASEQKFRVFPERRLLVAAAGLANLVFPWWEILESEDPPGGINELDHTATQTLRSSGMSW